MTISKKNLFAMKYLYCRVVDFDINYIFWQPILETKDIYCIAKNGVYFYEKRIIG